MAGAALADTLRRLPPRPTWLIAGVLNTKDAAGLLRPLTLLVRGASCIAIPGEANSLPAADLAVTARSVGIAATPADGLRQAAETIRAEMEKAGMEKDRKSTRLNSSH